MPYEDEIRVSKEDCTVSIKFLGGVRNWEIPNHGDSCDSDCMRGGCYFKVGDFTERFSQENNLSVNFSTGEKTWSYFKFSPLRGRMMKPFKVVPLCEKQLRDVNPLDILNGGLYRKCNIYKGGGGYDKFEEIYQKRAKSSTPCNMQFVVQLQGCPLNCPYCYVTKDGIWGNPVAVSAEDLLSAFEESGCDVHLMGGAPTLYIDYWADIVLRLGNEGIFHSDFLCLEGTYKPETLRLLAEDHYSLYAVSVKGSNPEEFKKNTNTFYNENLFWHNFGNLVKYKVPFYVTFTGMSESSILNFKQQVKVRFPTSYEKILEDSFAIDLVEYEALK